MDKKFTDTALDQNEIKKLEDQLSRLESDIRDSIEESPSIDLNTTEIRSLAVGLLIRGWAI